MAARKLQQEVDKCFKKVAEGVAEFEAIYEKIEQSNNPAQKEKLEDNLKREIKKLQRLRDQIKTWAASNDIKDKAPLLEQRKLIETQMEKFKAVEKAMKTKAYSKEGLSAAAKLDPKEQAKVEASDFLSSMVDRLEQSVESLELETTQIQSSVKKGKMPAAKAERLAEIDEKIERHKWHQGKLELIRRSLENGGVEAEQVNDLEESIRYYVDDHDKDDFMEDEELYDDLNLDEEQDAYGMNREDEKGSSQENRSEADDAPTEHETRPGPSGKTRSGDGTTGGGRRPSAQMKSPLPSLATLHAPLPTISNGNASTANMKPASLPTRPAEGLKYASAAAAAAAASEKNVGISPLPPPPTAVAATAIVPLPTAHPRSSATSSPAVSLAHPASSQEAKQVATATVTVGEQASSSKASSHGPPAKGESSKLASRSAPAKSTAVAPSVQPVPEVSEAPNGPHTNGVTNGVSSAEGRKEPEPIYHLPASLQDLVDSFEANRKRPMPATAPATLRLLQASQSNAPDVSDAEMPRIYRPDVPMPRTASRFPTQVLPIFEDPRLYSRVEPDTLFYVFYYKQGTVQQYLAAKALKEQSWRFHKQYQTWFQRHEEPKNITEEFEQGTYRFFDYESTWMNRRKADFKFQYKFLEDDVE